MVLGKSRIKYEGYDVLPSFPECQRGLSEWQNNPDFPLLLILGAEGIGKIRVAEQAHLREADRKGPLAIMNLAREEMQTVAALHERAREASGGTLIIRNIDQAPIELQHEVYSLIRYDSRQSDSEDRDVRVIVTAGDELHKLFSMGGFSPDLYYLATMIEIHIKPISDHFDTYFEDIILTVLSRMKRVYKMGSAVERVPDEIDERVVSEIKGYAWPGNFRELLAAISRVAVAESWQAISTYIDSRREKGSQVQLITKLFEQLFMWGQKNRGNISLLEFVNEEFEFSAVREAVSRVGASPMQIQNLIGVSSNVVSHRESYKEARRELGIGRRARARDVNG